MKQQSHDLIVIGGGIAGASFARSMALSGCSVLLLEREIRFRERLRGEGMHPWGVRKRVVSASTTGCWRAVAIIRGGGRSTTLAYRFGRVISRQPTRTACRS